MLLPEPERPVISTSRALRSPAGGGPAGGGLPGPLTVSFKLLLELARELARRMVALELEHVVARRDLYQDGDVAPQRHRHGDERHRRLEDGVHGLVEAEPVVGLARLPRRELDHQIDRLALAHR